MAAKTKADLIDVAAIFSDEEIDELDDRFDACTHGRKLRCDDCASRDWDQGRKDGFDLGFKYVISEIEKRAAEAFIKNQDSTAKHLRDIAKEIVEQGKKEKLWLKE